MGSVLTEFVGLLVDGIVTLAQGIATGIVAMAKALFLETNAETGAVTGLSIFGGLIGVFCSDTDSKGHTTKVYMWVTSLGKN